MMFDIDDIELLSIESKRNIKELNLATLDNLAEENRKLLGELIESISEEIKNLKDTRTKVKVLRKFKNKLIQVYKQNESIKPKEEFPTSKYAMHTESNVGYFKTHPDARFVEDEYHKIVKGYGNIIEFMENVYQYFRSSFNLSPSDKKILWDIVDKTKTTCSNLGIESIEQDILKKALSDPYKNIETIDDICDIDEEENGKDVVINSFPYTVEMPSFTVTGMTKYKILINNSKPRIYFIQKPLTYSKRTKPIKDKKMENNDNSSTSYRQETSTNPFSFIQHRIFRNHQPILLIEDKSLKTPLIGNLTYSNHDNSSPYFYHYTKEKIIQDLAINSQEEQIFNTPGMNDDEIKISQEKINSVKVKSYKK